MKHTDIQKSLRMVAVDWVDSSSGMGWERYDPVVDRPSTIRSAGLLIARKKDCISLSTSCGPRGGVMDTLTIPMSAVRSIRYLSLNSVQKKRSHK